ncbi:MAG: DUF1848 domain-containing protein [Anaerolineales bacterium]
MTISASRRTDIPAFYTPWFLKRLRAGYCTVPNPYNSSIVSTISLRPEDVDLIVFWTRNPRPLMPHLAELDREGYYYYFLITVLDYPRAIDTQGPALKASLKTFQKLADQIGPKKVIWRYDPILFTQATGVQFHLRTFTPIAQALRGYTHICKISLVTLYPKLQERLQKLAEQGFPVRDPRQKSGPRLGELLNTMADVASENGMQIQSCAETLDLRPYSIHPGKCIDDQLIREVFNLPVTAQKDPYQREACGCVASKDIGMYDTCLFGCQCCYATRSFRVSRINYQNHNPDSPSLMGWHEPSQGTDEDFVQTLPLFALKEGPEAVQE